MRLHIPLTCSPVGVLEPAADAGGRDSTVYAELKNAVKAWIVCFVNQAAANTIVWTPKQANTNAGGAAKVISANTRIYTNLDCQTIDAFTRQTDGASYTTDAGVKKKIIVFEIEPNLVMDVVNSFNYIGVTTGASAAANITSALVFVQPKYSGVDNLS